MFQSNRLDSQFGYLIAFALVITTLLPIRAAADTITSSLPPQISVTPNLLTPALVENGRAGGYFITVQNISNQSIGINPGVGIVLTPLGQPDKSDKVVSVAETKRTCPRSGLMPNRTCTIDFDIFPDKDGPEKENIDSGITSIKFTVTPNRGEAVSATAKVTVEDSAKTPEPASFSSLLSGLMIVAVICWLRTMRRRRLSSQP
jgi:hypothetical protein